jgi:hypothetical protein
MLLRSLHLAVLSVALLANAARADDTFHRTLPTSAQPDLYVSTGSGDIRVHAGPGSEIQITGHVHAGWGAFGDVRTRIQHIVENPPVQQSGNSVHVGESGDRSLFNNISIDYEIIVPANVALNLHSGSGEIDVNDAGRFLSASSGSGNVRAHQIHGPAELESDSGDIELVETGSGNVKAKTDSGSIRVHGLNGSFYARTGSGDIEADGRIDGASSLSTGSGGVRLHVTPDSHFNLEASTGSGDIRAHVPGVANADSDSTRHHLTMTIGGGGAPLEIRTSSGDIEVSPS